MSESAQWQARYETGDTPWEKGGPAPPLVDYLAQHAVTGRVLVPGCGSGHDVRALAAAGAEPVGLDIAPAAIERAERAPRIAREQYRLADLFQLPSDLIETFDWVFEHTCFCAIPLARRADYVRALDAALRPGGRLLAIFYMNPSDPEPDTPPFGSTPEELETLFGSVLELSASWQPKSAYPGREGRELMQLRVKRV